MQICRTLKGPTHGFTEQDGENMCKRCTSLVFCQVLTYLDMKAPTTAAIIGVGSPKMAETIALTAPPAI